MATIRGKAIGDVTNLLEDIDGTEKIPVSSGNTEPQVVLTGDLKEYINDGMQQELTFDDAPTSGSSNPVTSGGVYTALAGKQDTISDLDTIRSGASAGATAYQKPSGGIPKTDLESGVQASLDKADTALQSYTETDPVFEASAAAGITSSDITNWNSKTDNVGTITGITMNGASKGTSGVVDLGTVITEHQDISGKQDTLVSGTNIKTVNNQSLLGSGNITIESGSQITVDDAMSSTSENPVQNKVIYTALEGKADSADIPTKTSDLSNDSGYITSYTETDPIFTASPSYGITATDIAEWDAKSDFSGSYNDLTNKPTIPTVNDATLTIQKEGSSVGTFTANASSNATVNIVETDPVFAASVAHGITSTDITNWNNSPVLGDDDGQASDPDFDAYTDTVWHTEQTLSAAQQLQARTNIGAQEALVSGTNIKTINNTSLLGSGNITIEGGGSGTIDSALDTTSTNAVQNAVIATALNGKVGSSSITTIVSISQSAYDALASKDSATLYVITS